jgi:short-subunit dehydrogenase
MGMFTGKTVLITGASSGIGLALAREVAREGACLVLAARRKLRLDDLERELIATGATVLAIECDVTLDGDLERVVAAGVKRFGHIDVVVANAGFAVRAPFEKLTIADYRRQFETNVFGVLRTAYASLTELKRSHGSLVIVGSIAGSVARPGGTPYTMSKFALRGLAGGLRQELSEHGISVTLLTPLFVESEISRVDNQGILQAAMSNPVPRWLTISAETAAKKISKAIGSRKRELVFPLAGKIIFLIHRFCPWVFSRS